MNHINKCIYEKELEWNGIVNNKAWSIPIILTRTVIGAKLLYECFGKEDYECIVLTSEKEPKRVLRGRNSIRILYAWECDRDVNNGSKYTISNDNVFVQFRWPGTNRQYYAYVPLKKRCESYKLEHKMLEEVVP